MSATVFIEIDEYKQVLIQVDRIKQDLLKARKLLQELHDLRAQENAQIETAQVSLAHMKTRLVAVEGALDQ